MRLKTRSLGTVLLAISLTAGVALASIASHRISRSLGLRFDVTSTRSHVLSSETLSQLNTLREPCEILVVGSLAAGSIDPWSAQRAKDTLDEISERSELVRVRWIDPATADGARDTLELLDDLQARGADIYSAQRDALQSVIDAAGQVNESIRALPAGAIDQELVDRLGPTIVNAEARLGVSQGFLDRELEGRAIPAIAEAQNALTDLVGGYRAVGAALQPYPTPQVDRAIDVLIAVSSSAFAFEPDPSTLAASAIASSESVVALSSSGVRAVPLSSLFPPPPADASVGVSADAGPRVEATVRSMLRALSGEPRRGVVFVHGEIGEVLERTQVLTIFQDDLRSKGFDVYEWAPVVQPEPPAESGQEMIYVFIGTDAGADGPDARSKGPARTAAVAAALRSILERGDPMLISLPPSPLPAYGEVDPIAEVLREIGLDADTGRPILTSQTTPSGQLTAAEHTLLGDAEGSSVLGSAVRGLSFNMPWPIAIELGSTAAEPILSMTDERAWSETVWQTYRTIPIEQRRLVRDPPRYEPEAGDEQGPWVIAASLERESGQRLVVVGANRWFFDEVARTAGIVDGRRVLATPGNVELLYASLDWLSGEPVRASADRVRVPRIQTLSEGMLLTIRLACGLGLPLGVLAAGACVLLARR